MDRHPRRHRPLPRPVRRGLILAALLAAVPAWASTYRWVDDKGLVHYGDVLPAYQAGKGYVELSLDGRVVRRVERTPTAAVPQQKDEYLHSRQDRALLATYVQVEDIDRARERALAQEAAMLESLRVQRMNSASPQETEAVDARIRARQSAIEALKTKFDADRARFLELRRGR